MLVVVHFQHQCTQGHIAEYVKSKVNPGAICNRPKKPRRYKVCVLVFLYVCIFVFGGSACVCMTFHNTQPPLFWGVGLCSHAWAIVRMWRCDKLKVFSKTTNAIQTAMDSVFHIDGSRPSD